MWSWNFWNNDLPSQTGGSGLDSGLHSGYSFKLCLSVYQCMCLLQHPLVPLVGFTIDSTSMLRTWHFFTCSRSLHWLITVKPWSRCDPVAVTTLIEHITRPCIRGQLEDKRGLKTEALLLEIFRINLSLDVAQLIVDRCQFCNTPVHACFKY